MNAVDAVSAKLDGAGAMLGRVDTDRITDLVADLSVADLMTSVSSAADRVGDQVGTAMDEGRRRTSQTSRLVLAAGIVAIVIGGVVLIRRRRNVDNSVDTSFDGQLRSAGAANPN